MSAQKAQTIATSMLCAPTLLEVSHVPAMRDFLEMELTVKVSQMLDVPFILTLVYDAPRLLCWFLVSLKQSPFDIYLDCHLWF